MASDGNDGLIDLENLVRDIDAPEGKAAPAPVAAEPEPAESRLAAVDEESTGPSAEPPSTSAETSQESALGEELTASPVKEPARLDKSAEEKPVAEAAPEVSTEALLGVPENADLSEEELEAILITESPELAEEVSAIREVAKTPLEGSDSTDEIDDVLSVQGEVGLWTRVRRHLNVVLLKILALVAGVKTFFLRMVRDSKGLLLEIVAGAKVSLRTSYINRKTQLGIGWKWFASRTLGQKLSIFAALMTAGLAGGVAYRMAKGTLLPETKREWIANFAEQADGVFQYEATEPTEDFNDPILHPEFVVAIERVVVNLRRTPEAESNSNPMAAFEFFIQSDSQIGAIEVKDRNVEIRDQIARAVEQMTYPELATDDGKARLKLVLRKQLNEIMTKGRVRRVYFKTIVLNPE